MPDPIAAVADHLRASGVPFAVIGAAAMSTRGFPRQTLDFDILNTDDRILRLEFWKIVVGRHRWQSDAVSRAQEMTIGRNKLPVVTLGDLMLLKLDAGGYRDASDVKTMLTGATDADIQHVTSHLAELDDRAQRLWSEIRAN